MNKTEHYNLNQWQLHDRVMMQDFNADNAKIDAALAGHAAQIAKLGNCSVGAFTYTGTGTSGADGPTVIAFPKVPLFAIVRGGSKEIMFIQTTKLSPLLDYDGGGFIPANYHWTGSTLYLYHGSDVRFQCNLKGVTYYVVAFYAEDKE